MLSHRDFAACILRGLSTTAMLLSACTPVVTFITPTISATGSPVNTKTPLPTASATATTTPTPRTPTALPAPYQNSSLTPFGSPHTYIQDQCLYLKDKWSSKNSAPGTVVMTIMFHSISNGMNSSTNEISEYGLRILMSKLHDEGFTAINTTQMADFMEHNSKIPERSVLLVVDDRHFAQYFNLYFLEYWTKYGWPVVNAWISLDDANGAAALPDNIALENEGWVDHQAHGYIHNTPIGPDSTEKFILGELQKPIEVFQENFHKTPIAIIWPGGGFTPGAAEVARQLGYRLGFTTNPRGPVMFNWVPLADMVDTERLTWIPEGLVNDPLMVLPRYWDTDAITHIDEVIQAGREASAYAGQNKAVELEYYDIACEAHYGPIP